MSTIGTLQIEMMANVARLQRDMQQAKAAVGDAAFKMSSDMAAMRKSIEDAAAAAKPALDRITLGILGISAALAAIPKTAFDFSKNLETSAVGMAGIISSVTALNGQQLKYNQALAISQSMIRQLNDDALRTAASSQELVGAFQALLAPGLAAGMKLDEIRQLTVVGTNAVRSMGLTSNQVVQELRDLVAGGITASSSTLATSLGLKDADIAKAKASSEGLFQFIMNRLRGMEQATDEYGKTLEGRLSALKEGATRVAADGMEPLTRAISESLAQMSDLLVTFDQAGKAQLDPQLVEGLRGVSESMVGIMSAGKSAISVLWDNRDAVTALAGAYAALKIGEWAAGMQAAVSAKIALTQASQLAAVQAVAEGSANEVATQTTRQKTAALLADLQARAQSTAATLREALAHEAAAAARVAEIRATLESTAANGSNAALISGSLVPALLASEAAALAKANAERAAALASHQLATATRAASVSGQAMGAVMGAMGGPVGIAVTAISALVMWLGHAVSQASEAEVSLLKYSRMMAAVRNGGEIDPGDLMDSRLKLSELKQQRDELLAKKANPGVMAFLFGNDYRIGLNADLADVEQQIKERTANIARADEATRNTSASTAGLTLTLGGAEQAWKKANDGIGTTSSVQAEYKEKLAASRQAYEAYIAQVRAKGMSEEFIQQRQTEQAQAEAALLKQRDDALKSLNGTRAAGAKAVDGELASLQAKLAAEQQYALELARYGLDADKRTAAERDVAKLQYEVAQAKDAKTRATFQARLAVAEELAVQQKHNATLVEWLQSGKAVIDDLSKQADASGQSADALEAEAAAWGKSKSAIEAATLAKLQWKRANIDGSESDAYLQQLDRAIKEQGRLVDALQAVDYKKQSQAIEEWSRAAAEQAKLYADEAQLAGLSGLERAKILAARQVELKLAKQLAEIDRQTLDEDKKKLLRQQADDAATVDSAAAVAKAVQDNWTKVSDQINQSLTDALMRGFESGKGFAKNLVDTIKNLFSTLVLRREIQAVVNPIAGALTGGLGLAGTAQAGQAAIGSAGNLTGLYSGISMLGTSAIGALGAGVSSIGGMAESASMTAYGAGMQYGAAGWQPALLLQGGEITAGTSAAATSGANMASTVGPYANALGGAMVGFMAGKMISGGYSALGSSGNTAVTLGTAAGAAIGSVIPVIGTAIGAAIGGALGGVANRAFGMKAKEITGEGLVGTLSASGASVQQYADWQQQGGWLRSDRSGTEYSAVSTELDRMLDKAVTGIRTATAGYAASIGLSASAVDGYSEQIRISLRGLDQAGQQKAITGMLASFGTNMVQDAFGPALQAFQRDGETVDATLARLSGSLLGVNAVLDTLGQRLYGVSVSSADAASQLVDLFGGLDAMKSQTAAYYQNFYTEAERTATTTRQLSAALAALGLQLPETRAGWRALVEAQDLMTTNGRTTYAALIGLSQQFDSIAPKIDTVAGKFGSLIGSLSDQATQLIDQQIKSSQSAAKAARDVATAYQGAMSSLNAAADSILMKRTGGLPSAQMAYQAQLERARGGDVEAMKALPGLADALLVEVKGSARTASDFAIASARVANELRGVAAVADALGVGADYQAKIYDVNTSLLETTRDLLASGNLTADLLQQIRGALGKVDQSIRDSANLTVGVTQSGHSGIVGALFDSSGRVVAGLNAETVLQLAGIQGQTASLSGLTQQQIAQLQALGSTQTKALGLTDIVADATGGSETLLNAVLKRLTLQDSGSSDIVGALNRGNSDLLMKLAGIEGAIRQQSAAQAAEQQRQQNLSKAQAALEQLIQQQKTAVAAVNSGIQGIWSLASQYGVSLHQSNGAAASFAVDSSGHFAATYDYLYGTNSATSGFKDAYYASGGVYEQTYGRTGQLNDISSQIETQRQIIRDLGGVPAFAEGGLYRGGLALVGEEGPELINFGSPGQVYTAAQTGSILNSGNSELVSELRSVREELTLLRAEVRADVAHNAKTAKLLYRAMPDGRSIQVTTAA